MTYEEQYKLLEYLKNNNIPMTNKIIKFIKKRENISEQEYPIFKYPFKVICFYFHNRNMAIFNELLKPETKLLEPALIIKKCSELLKNEEIPFELPKKNLSNAEDFKTATLLEENNMEAIPKLALAYFEQKNYEKASLYFTKLKLRENNDFIVPYYLLLDEPHFKLIYNDFFANLPETLDAKYLCLLKDTIIFLINKNASFMAKSLLTLLNFYSKTPDYILKCMLLAERNANYELASFLSLTLNELSSKNFPISQFFHDISLIPSLEVNAGQELLIYELINTKNDFYPLLREYNLSKEEKLVALLIAIKELRKQNKMKKSFLLLTLYCHLKEEELINKEEETLNLS